MVADERGQFAGHGLMVAEPQVEGGAVLVRDEPALFQLGGLVLDGTAADPGRGPALPEGEPPVEEFGGRADVLGAGGPLRALDQGGELHRVDPVPLGEETIAGVLGNNDVTGHSGAPENLAQPGYTDRHLRSRRGRRLPFPDLLHQGVDRHDRAHGQYQHDEYGSLPRATNGHGFPAPGYRQRSQKPDVESRTRLAAHRSPPPYGPKPARGGSTQRPAPRPVHWPRPYVRARPRGRIISHAIHVSGTPAFRIRDRKTAEAPGTEDSRFGKNKPSGYNYPLPADFSTAAAK